MGRIPTLCFLFLMSLLKLQAQDLTLADFEEKSISNLNSNSRSSDLAYSKLTPWRVYTEGGNLKISKQNWKRPDPEVAPFPIDKTCGLKGLNGGAVSKKVSNGWLVIRFCDLFSDLSWYSNDGKSSYVISKNQYAKFAEHKGKLITFHNPSHMGFNSGGIYEIYLDNNDSKWKLKEVYASSKSYPIAISSDKDENDLVVTSSALVKISGQKKVEYLMNDMYGSVLSTPNSIALHEGSIYLGMHGGILKVTEKKDSIEVKWLEEKHIKE
jgi:hypothetical protein